MQKEKELAERHARQQKEELANAKKLHDDKLKEVGNRIKLNHRIVRCINIDVAHGKIETIYAVFSIIKRLAMNYINLNNKGGCNND